MESKKYKLLESKLRKMIREEILKEDTSQNEKIARQIQISIFQLLNNDIDVNLNYSSIKGISEKYARDIVQNLIAHGILSK